MNGYRYNQQQSGGGGAAPNTGEPTIDAGNATTTYSGANFDNGGATVPTETPVRFDFGAAT